MTQLRDLLQKLKKRAAAESEVELTFDSTRLFLREAAAALPALLDVADAAQAALEALDGEIEQHEAFFLQSPSTSGAFDALHRAGIQQAKRERDALRTALTALKGEK